MINKESGSNEVQITLTMRQLSIIVAGLLLIGFFVFITGYFLGKKRAVEEFSYKTDQESLADQIYSSMCILYDSKDDNEELTDSEDDNENIELASQAPIEDVQQVPAPLPSKYYKAPLAGFASGLCADAKKMVTRLTNKGFSVELVERAGKGKKVWYQVVTKPCQSRDSLVESIKQIAKLEHLKENNINIIECV